MLELTPAAKQALLDQMSTIAKLRPEFRPVPSFGFRSDTSFGEVLPNNDRNWALGPHWTISYTDLPSVRPEDICHIDGIPFVYGAERPNRYLDEATIDFVEGEFVFSKRAI